MNFTLKQLRYFVLAAELKSVTQASAKANISQPSISSAIAELEAAFDTKLFVRHHAKGLSLTAVGHQIFAEAKRLLIQAEGFTQVSNELVRGLSGTVDVGCLLTLAPLVMPPLMKAISSDYPNLSVGCRELDIKEVLDGLRAGAIEIADDHSIDCRIKRFYACNCMFHEFRSGHFPRLQGDHKFVGRTIVPFR